VLSVLLIRINNFKYKFIIQKYCTDVKENSTKFLEIVQKDEMMRYLDLLKDLQNLTNEKLTDRRMMAALELKTPSAITYKKANNSFVTDDEIEKIENSFNIRFSNTDADCIEVEHIHINPSCGHGTIVLDEPDVTPIKLGKRMLETILKVSDPKNLKTFTASGDSMEDTIDDGNVLLVDIGRTDYNNGGIFVITINNDWFVKRIRKRLNGELDIISDNITKYPIETYRPNDDIEIKIQGRVIKNLSKGL
jgi:phage repressor protein C with HTH and peptisase S24 domain